MATTNPFDLLGDSENDDLSLLIAAQQKKLVARPPAATSPTAAKLPSKPLPPAQAVREARNNAATIREGTGRGGSGRSGRGAGTGQNRDFDNGNYTRYGGGRGGLSVENGDAGDLSERGRGSSGQYRGSFRGGRRGGYVSGSGEGGLDPDRPQRRVYERRSGTGIGYDMKKEGAGRGNWGTVTDEVHAQEAEESVIVDEKVETPEKQVEQNDGNVADASKDKKEEAAHEVEKEPEDNEMTLEEYEKIREEKRKALLSLKVEERKVEIDKELQSMQQLALKKGNDEVFIKLSSSDKDSPKLRDNAEKEERIKKAVNIHEFLKPAEGGRYYNPSGRGRGRGGRGGDREPFRGGYTGGASIPPVIPSIEDQGQFPALGAK